MADRIAELEAEVQRLTDAIKLHHSKKGDDRCWMDDVNLYAVLGLPSPYTLLPERPQFAVSCTRYCERFYDTRQHPTDLALGASPYKMTIAEMEAEIIRLRRLVGEDDVNDGLSGLHQP